MQDRREMRKNSRRIKSAGESRPKFHLPLESITKHSATKSVSSRVTVSTSRSSNSSNITALSPISSTSRKTMSLSDIYKLETRFKQLAKLMRLPKIDQQYYLRVFVYHDDPQPDLLSVVIDVLEQYKNRTIDVIRAIHEREHLVNELQMLMDAHKLDSDMDKLKILQDRAAFYLRELQYIGLEVVESIIKWRQLLTRPYSFELEPFGNYLMKIKADCKLFDDSSLSTSMFTTFQRSGFLLSKFTAVDFVGDSSQFEQMERKFSPLVDAFKPLSPSKKGSDLPSARRLYKRLQKAESVIRGEEEIQMVVQMDREQKKKKSMFIPVLDTRSILPSCKDGIEIDGYSYSAKRSYVNKDSGDRSTVTSGSLEENENELEVEMEPEETKAETSVEIEVVTTEVKVELKENIPVKQEEEEESDEEQGIINNDEDEGEFEEENNDDKVTIDSPSIQVESTYLINNDNDNQFKSELDQIRKESPRPKEDKEESIITLDDLDNFKASTVTSRTKDPNYSTNGAISHQAAENKGIQNVEHKPVTVESNPVPVVKEKEQKKEEKKENSQNQVPKETKIPVKNEPDDDDIDIGGEFDDLSDTEAEEKDEMPEISEHKPLHTEPLEPKGTEESKASTTQATMDDLDDYFDEDNFDDFDEEYI